MNFWTTILPAIATILGNIIFYLIIKGRVDNSIEKHKISYSGIFKERIDIYKELLRRIFEIKQSIQRYQYFATPDEQKIMDDINNFINYYLINQPFLSDKMLSELKKIREEFQSAFDSFYMHHKTSLTPGLNPETRNQFLTKFIESGNKFKTDHPFKTLEETIIKEMKASLRVDKL
jgi:hypothetical protein